MNSSGGLPLAGHLRVAALQKGPGPINPLMSGTVIYRYCIGFFDELCEKFWRTASHEGSQQALKSLMLVAAPAVQINFIKPVERWYTTCLCPLSL